jgi:hypothetical protein
MLASNNRTSDQNGTLSSLPRRDPHPPRRRFPAVLSGSSLPQSHSCPRRRPDFHLYTLLGDPGRQILATGHGHNHNHSHGQSHNPRPRPIVLPVAVASTLRHEDPNNLSKPAKMSIYDIDQAGDVLFALSERFSFTTSQLLC